MPTREELLADGLNEAGNALTVAWNRAKWEPELFTPDWFMGHYNYYLDRLVNHPNLKAAQPDPSRVPAQLTFAAFSAVNRERCESPQGFDHQLASWSTSDWFTAILGELGEAANVAKKLNRYRDGVRGNKEAEGVLRVKLRQELGDTFVYLDLLCQSLGFTVEQAAVEVFDAKSDEIGSPLKASSLSSSSHTSGVCERCGVFSDPLYHTCEACRAEFNRLAGSSQSQPEGWQDIATAPKDGKPFCGGWIHRIYGWCWGAARWQNDPNIEGGGYFYADGGGAPTHWMPLPLPPVPQTGT